MSLPGAARRARCRLCRLPDVQLSRRFSTAKPGAGDSDPGGAAKSGHDSNGEVWRGGQEEGEGNVDPGGVSQLSGV